MALTKAASSLHNRNTPRHHPTPATYRIQSNTPANP